MEPEGIISLVGSAVAIGLGAFAALKKERRTDDELEHRQKTEDQEQKSEEQQELIQELKAELKRQRGDALKADGKISDFYQKRLQATEEELGRREVKWGEQISSLERELEEIRNEHQRCRELTARQEERQKIQEENIRSLHSHLATLGEQLKKRGIDPGSQLFEALKDGGE